MQTGHPVEPRRCRGRPTNSARYRMRHLWRERDTTLQASRWRTSIRAAGLAAVAAATLVACGGGGSSNSSSDAEHATQMRRAQGVQTQSALPTEAEARRFLTRAT